MPLFTKAILGGLAALISIPVFGLPLIAANYPSPITDHLADIEQGVNTYVVDALNAPNWAIGLQLQQVQGVTAATSTTSGTVASSTAFTFVVSALDGFGTTTQSASVVQSTDAATSPNEEIVVSWGSVPSATGYAIYFATGTNATTFTQYFLATSSTNGTPNTNYVFSTSTGSIYGTYTKKDVTAYSVKIRPDGPSYLNGGSFSVGTTTGVADATLASVNFNATTAIQLGKGGQAKGTCLKLYRSDGTPVYATVNAGATSFTLTTTATACANVTGF
jgi:hypothetical protein